MATAFQSGDWVIHSVDPSSTKELGDFVHPDDRARIKVYGPFFGRPCEIVDELDGYLAVRIGSDTFRLRPGALKKIPKPKKRCGEKVTVMIKGQLVERRVSAVVWHFARQEPYYFLLRESGKVSTKWYFENDFIDD